MRVSYADSDTYGYADDHTDHGNEYAYANSDEHADEHSDHHADEHSNADPDAHTDETPTNTPTITPTNTPTRTPTPTPTNTPTPTPTRTNTPTGTPTNTPTPTPISPGSDFYTVAPCRQYDSRDSAALPDNTNRSVTLIGAPCGVPPTAVAVSVNITVFSITGAGGNAVFQVGTANNPTFAWINYPPSETQRGNAGFLPLNGSGQIVVKLNQGGGSINFVVDGNGYFQ